MIGALLNSRHGQSRINQSTIENQKSLMPDKKDNKRDQGLIDPNEFERELTTDLDEETPDKPKGLALHTRILIGLGVGVIAGLICNWIFLGGARKMALVNPF